MVTTKVKKKPPSKILRSQLSLPITNDSSQLFDVGRPNKRISIANIPEAVLQGSDSNRNLDQISNFSKTQELLHSKAQKSDTGASKWVKSDNSWLNIRHKVEVNERSELQNKIQLILAPRVNYQLLDKKIKSVSGCRFVNFYITESGDLYSSGLHICGILGRNGTRKEKSFYTQQLIDLSAESKTSCVQSGVKHAVVLTQSNEIYTWGYNNLGQLGISNSDFRKIMKTEYNNKTGDYFEYSNAPEIVPFFYKNNRLLISAISCGSNFTVALTSAGKMYGWGDNTHYQLAVENSTSPLVTISDEGSKYYIREPLEISCFHISNQLYSDKVEKEEAKIQSVICGSEYSYAITQDLKVFFWGRSTYGLNLKPNRCIEKKPLHLHILDGKKIQILSTYENHTLALGHCIELSFTHETLGGEIIKITGIPNDVGLMDINLFTTPKQEILVVNDFDMPYVLLKRKMKRVKLTKRGREKLIFKILRSDLEQLNDKEIDDEEEEESEEEEE